MALSGSIIFCALQDTSKVANNAADPIKRNIFISPVLLLIRPLIAAYLLHSQLLLTTKLKHVNAMGICPKRPESLGSTSDADAQLSQNNPIRDNVYA